MKHVIENLKEREFLVRESDCPNRATDATQQSLFEMEAKELPKEKLKARRDLESLFSMIWGQCSLSMRAKLKGKETFNAIREAMNTTESIELIKEMCHGFQEIKCSPMSIHEILDQFVNCKQKEDESNQKCLECFMNAIQALEANKTSMVVQDLI